MCYVHGGSFSSYGVELKEKLVKKKGVSAFWLTLDTLVKEVGERVLGS